MSQSLLTSHEQAADPIVVIEKIASKDPIEQLQASKALESGNPVYFEALLKVLERENRKKPKRFGIAVTVMIVSTLALMGILSKFLGVNVSNFFNGLWWVFVGLAAAYAPTRLQKAAAAKIAESEELRAVGPLAEALDKQDDATKKTAAKALERLLPRLKHSDADLLDDRQMGFILKGFHEGKPEFKIAVLKSLPQIGDERFLKSVTALADGKGAAKKNAELKDLAAECLEPLKTRIEEDKTRLSLLHPVESPNGQADTLLRAAGSSQTDPQVLLRASASTESTHDQVSKLPGNPA